MKDPPSQNPNVNYYKIEMCALAHNGAHLLAPTIKMVYISEHIVHALANKIFFQLEYLKDVRHLT